MNLYQRNMQNAEKKAIWLLVSVRYAFNQFKFNRNEQKTSSAARKQAARPKHSH